MKFCNENIRKICNVSIDYSKFENFEHIGGALYKAFLVHKEVVLHYIDEENKSKFLTQVI